MLRIGKMADYALLITNQMVAASNQLRTTDALAGATHLPLATVRKLLKQLVDAGIVKSHRGVNGGYTLAQNPDLVSVADVIIAIEGPISLTQCATTPNSCDLMANCALKSNWSLLNNLLADMLQKISLSEMSGKMALDNKGLHSVSLAQTNRH